MMAITDEIYHVHMPCVMSTIVHIDHIASTYKQTPGTVVVAKVSVSMSKFLLFDIDCSLHLKQS